MGTLCFAHPTATSRFIGRLAKSFTPLLGNPMMGKARDALSPGLRAHSFRDYVIYYLPTAREIIIVRVVHGRRDQAALFRKE